jgi:hypothetical protein
MPPREKIEVNDDDSYDLYGSDFKYYAFIAIMTILVTASAIGIGLILSHFI